MVCRDYGQGYPCFIVAEIGANHDGDVERCLRTIDAALRAGVDAVKLQYYRAADLVADVDRVWTWGPEGQRSDERVGDMFDRLSLSSADLERAFAYAERVGITLFCTPFSVRGVEDLARLGNPIYKVASSDVAFYPMLRAIARQRRPVMLSTGKCTLRDVDDALAALEGVPDSSLALLHCIAQYPAPYEQMNVRVVETYRHRYPNHPVGLSDHCMTPEPALAAVALGATVVEKHFTLDRGFAGPDHWFSMDEPAMTDFVRSVRRLEASLGDGQKGIAPCELWEAEYSTRSIIVMRDLPRGHRLEPDDLALLRPGNGLHPRCYERVLGRPLACDVRAREPLLWDMLEGGNDCDE